MTDVSLSGPTRTAALNRWIRFEEKIVRISESGCWVWDGSLSPEGYGKLTVNRRTSYAHRVAYERYVGPIQRGLQLDHLCRVRCCVNPSHLEPVTQRMNALRGACGDVTRDRHAKKCACKSGHEFTAENTYFYIRSGYKCRVCKQCNRDRSRDYKQRKTREVR